MVKATDGLVNFQSMSKVKQNQWFCRYSMITVFGKAHIVNVVWNMYTC